MRVRFPSPALRERRPALIRQSGPVSDPCEHEGLFVLFGSRKWNDRQRAVVGALSDPHADALLAQMLDAARYSDNVEIAAQLGDLRGDAGTAALRRAVSATGPQTRDLRCAALLALAKRCGPDATPWLRDALEARDSAVKDYAIIGLAGAGDDRAWNQVADRLRTLVRRASKTEWPASEVLMAFAYLARHLGANTERRRELVNLVRKNWSTRRVDEQHWFDRYWPDAAPGGPSAENVGPPDADAIQAWARDPLFGPVLPP
jgi:hypothetical protein